MRESAALPCLRRHRTSLCAAAVAVLSACTAAAPSAGTTAPPAPAADAPKPAATVHRGPRQYTRVIPPESAEAREARHKKVAERRAQDVLVIVHRGAWLHAPENTLESYAAAMDMGADGCEFDPRRAADGVLYMLHDDTLDRVTGCSGKAKLKTYDELFACKFKKIFGAATADTRIPTFAAFLVLARQRAMLLHFDNKEPGLQDDEIRMLEEADMWDHVVEVNGGNGETLRAHSKVKLLPYKGWIADVRKRTSPEPPAVTLARPGRMVICDDPEVAVEALGRKPVTPVPLPDEVREPAAAVR